MASAGDCLSLRGGYLCSALRLMAFCCGAIFVFAKFSRCRVMPAVFEAGELKV